MSNHADCLCSQLLNRVFSYYTVIIYNKAVFQCVLPLNIMDLCKPADTPERNTALV